MNKNILILSLTIFLILSFSTIAFSEENMGVWNAISELQKQINDLKTTVCPDGMIKVKNICIDNEEKNNINYLELADECYNKNSRICKLEELYLGCKNIDNFRLSGDIALENGMFIVFHTDVNCENLIEGNNYYVISGYSYSEPSFSGRCCK